MTLEAFFETMEPFLRGRITAEEVERKLGPSASGAERLALYPRLVRAQHTGAVRRLFPALHRALEAHRTGLWAKIVDAYVAEHTDGRWNPSWFGEAMAEFLVAYREHEPDLPPFAEQLADFHWLDFVLTADPRDLAVDVEVRHYTHDVPSYVRGRLEGVPEEKAVTILAYRPADGRRMEVISATPAVLVALARAREEAVPELSALGIRERDVDKARRRLRRLGIVK